MLSVTHSVFVERLFCVWQCLKSGGGQGEQSMTRKSLWTSRERVNGPFYHRGGMGSKQRGI